MPVLLTCSKGAAPAIHGGYIDVIESYDVISALDHDGIDVAIILMVIFVMPLVGLMINTALMLKIQIHHLFWWPFADRISSYILSMLMNLLHMLLN